MRPLGVINWAADQGSDGFCASWCLLRAMKLQGVRFDDASHRVQNDLRLAIVDTSPLYDQSLLNGIASNMPWGPWHSGAWWQQLQEAARSYFSKANSDDPLFRWLASRIARDYSFEGRLAEPNFHA